MTLNDLTTRDRWLIGSALALAIETDKARAEIDQRPSDRNDMERLARLFPRPARAASEIEILTLAHELVQRVEETPAGAVVAQLTRRIADTADALART